MLPWTIENADAGIVACMARWVAQRGNVDTAGEIVRAALQIEADLVAGMSDRFIHIHKTGKGGRRLRRPTRSSSRRRSSLTAT